MGSAEGRNVGNGRGICLVAPTNGILAMFWFRECFGLGIGEDGGQCSCMLPSCRSGTCGGNVEHVYNMRIGMCIDMRTDMRTGMLIDMGVGMCMDMCMDMGIGMCVDTCM